MLIIILIIIGLVIFFVVRKKKKKKAMNQVESVESSVDEHSEPKSSISSKFKSSVSDMKDKAQSVLDRSNQGNDTKADEPDNGYHEEDGQLVITSMDGLKKWLNGLRVGSAPSAVQTIESQLQILNLVSSPTMIGMATDTIVDALRKALKTANSDEEKEEIRDAYASMIQTYFFFSEAKLRFAIDKNQREAAVLLEQAGDMLGNCVMSAAKVVAATDSNPVDARELGSNASVVQRYRDTFSVVVKNFFSSLPNQTDFFSRMTSWINDKKEVEKKIDEHFKAIDSVFETFDYYYSVIGPSILVHGMMMKYRSSLVARFKEKQFEPIQKKIKASNAGALIDEIGNNLSNGSKGSIFKAGVNIATSIGRTIAKNKEDLSELELFYNLVSAVDDDIKKRKETLAAHQQEVLDMRNQLESYTGMDSRKGALKKEIKAKETVIKDEKAKLADMEKKAESLNGICTKENLLKMKEESEKYEANLRRIEEKFIYTM